MEKFSREDALQQVLADVENLMEDLYQSGFDTVHDSTLKSFDAMAEHTAAYGMDLLSELLTQLVGGLKMRRHQIQGQGTQDGLAGIYTKLSLYIDLCKDKIELDKGIGYYTNIHK
ncbi:MAG: hypothetical protein K2O40_05675 [Lachnospiraceae bacterium]|nr:hypothetical protein [Lachnospiraceae bacterium]MDE7183962.1 hypothetical protein [Lachnospiraceae bacterium]